MKIKYDFVTNSSSTSFVVWGVYRNWNDEFLRKIWENSNKRDIAFEDFVELSWWELAGIISSAAEKYKLEAGTQEDGNCSMIGVSPFVMKENQTLAEFKKFICVSLSDFLGEKISPRSLQQIETEIPQ